MEVSVQLHAPAALSPWKEHLIHILLEIGSVPELVWTQRWREKFVAHTGTWTPDHPAHSPALYGWIYQFSQ